MQFTSIINFCLNVQNSQKNESAKIESDFSDSEFDMCDASLSKKSWLHQNGTSMNHDDFENEEKNYEETISELESKKDLIQGFGQMD